MSQSHVDTGVSLEVARRCERAGREITATYARAVDGLRSNGNDPLLPVYGSQRADSASPRRLRRRI